MAVPNVVSIRPSHEDDNVEVNFFTGRVHLRCERPSASSLLLLLEPESVADLRVSEVIIILAVDD